MKRMYVLLSGMIWMACQAPAFNPAEIIRKSIQYSGGRISDGRLEFTVSDRNYFYHRQGEVLSIGRTFSDSTASIRDLLNKKGFMRSVDSLTEILPDSLSSQLAETLSSEMMISLLPFSLEEYADQAINMGLDSIGQELLFHARIPLDAPSGSGRLDCWFNPDTNKLRFAATTRAAWGEGPWFYEAVDAQTTGGVRLSDYVRYQPVHDDFSHPSMKPHAIEQTFDSFGSLFSKGQLKLIDTLRLRDVKAELR